MVILNKNFLLIGYQTASLKILQKSLKIKGCKRAKLINISNFSKKFIKDQKIHNNLNFLKRYKKNYKFIVGTSEQPFEYKITKFLKKNNVNFFCYIDSIINLRERFQYYNKLPENIITINNIIKKEIRLNLIEKKNKTKIYVLNMPYQTYLKRKYYKLKRNNNNLLYLTSDFGVNFEKKIVSKLYKTFKFNLFFIGIHPRESLKLWKKNFNNLKNIKVTLNKSFFNNKNISNVYGISTSALVDYKFAGFDVSYINTKILKKNPIIKIFKFYKIKPLNLK